jgi:plastocyanin
MVTCCELEPPAIRTLDYWSVLRHSVKQSTEGMKMGNRRLVTIVGMAALLLVVSACGDDGPDETSTASTTATAAMDDDEMAEMAEMDEMEEGADEHGDFDFGEPVAAADADRVVEIVTDDDFTITPSEMTITVGETVTFKVTNEGKLTHDFTLGRAGPTG